METKLGMGKVYLKAQDIGKMLKLKDVENLVITNVNIKDSKDLEIEIATPICNKTNNRIRDFKENKTYHIGIDYIKNRKTMITSVFEEENGRYTLIELTKDYNSVTEVIDKFNSKLYDCKFYIDKKGFGMEIYDNLLALDISKKSIICIDFNETNLTKIDLYKKLKNIGVCNKLEYKYTQILNEIYELQQVVTPSGKICFIDNNESGFLDVILLFLWNTVI